MTVCAAHVYRARMPKLLTTVTFTLSWGERLRALLGREVRVRVEATTNVELKKAEGRSDVSVEPLFAAAPAKRMPYAREPQRDHSIYREGDEADPRFLDFSRRDRGTLYIRRG